MRIDGLVLAVVGVGVVGAVACQGQMQGQGGVLHATGPLPSYEVTTIKPAASNDRNGVTVKSEIKAAFNLPNMDGVVLGGPPWIDKDRYVFGGKMQEADQAAMRKAPIDKQLTEFHLLQQSRLRDRFKLKVHFEKRTMPVYELVVAKGGPKLRPPTMLPADAANPVPRPRSWFQMDGAGKLSGAGVSMAGTAVMLSRQPELGSTGLGITGRIVIDKTGLTGAYDWTLDWTPESMDPASPNANKPELFTALQEQLGLKLVPAKDPVEVLVIDHIERPSEN